MRLIAAAGSADMQAALSHPYVKTIVTTLLQLQDRNFFRLVTQFLKQNEQGNTTKFEQDLVFLRGYYRRKPNVEGLITTPPHVDILAQTLQDLYQQDERKVRYQRGAILELFVRNLICPRYKSSECAGNQRFIDERGRNITDQVDVAALSHEQRQIEGYECKIKAAGIESVDCTNLIALVQAAQERDYQVNVGIVSFDNDWLVKSRLKHFEVPSSVKPYGLDSIEVLRKNPF